MTKQFYQLICMVAVLGFMFALAACKPIQPVAVTARNVAPAQQPTVVATSTNTEPIDAQGRLRTIAEIAAQAIFTPSQPYSGTFVSLLMGMPVLWVDYTVTKSDEVHGYIHGAPSAAPDAIAYECEQTATGSRFFPQPLPTNAMRFSPCNLPFQLMATVLPGVTKSANFDGLFGESTMTFDHFVSLGQKEIPTQFEFLGKKADTRLADGYQFTTATSTVELWLDSETGLPILLNNIPLDGNGALIPFQSFAFTIRW